MHFFPASMALMYTSPSPLSSIRKCLCMTNNASAASAATMILCQLPGPEILARTSHAHLLSSRSPTLEISHTNVKTSGNSSKIFDRGALRLSNLCIAKPKFWMAFANLIEPSRTWAFFHTALYFAEFLSFAQHSKMNNYCNTRQKNLLFEIGR